MSNKYKLYSKLLQKEDDTKKLKKQQQKLQIQKGEKQSELDKTNSTR